MIEDLKVLIQKFPKVQFRELSLNSTNSGKIGEAAIVVVVVYSCYYTMLHRVWYCYGKSSIRLFVHLSVMLRYCGHISWNSWKIILWLISLAFLFSADPNIHPRSAPKGTPQILAGIGVGYGKIGSERTKLAISLKRGKIE